MPRPSDGYRADEGLSFPLMTIIDKLHDVQVFWIVRHPLDTICSLRLGIGRNWGHHPNPRPPDWRDWLLNPLLIQYAHHWNYINSVSFQKVETLAKVMFFEDMISDPQTFANEVLGKSDIENPEIKGWCKRVQNTNNRNFVEAKTSKAYSTMEHSCRAGRYS